MRDLANLIRCAICGRYFSPYAGMRKDVRGKFWCKPCQDDFDKIDWDEVRDAKA